MKKILVLALTGSLLICMAGCGSDSSTGSSGSSTETVESGDEVVESGAVEVEDDAEGVEITEETATAEEPEEIEETKSSKVSKDSIKAGEIDWKVEDTIIDGYHRCVFSYVNNSAYTIAEIDMEWTQREDLTDEEKTVFDDFVAENDAWDESEIADMYASVYLTQIVAPGEESKEKELFLNNSWYYLPDISQYEIMEPSMIAIYFITDNDTLFTSYYDFKTDTYGESSSGETPAHEWSDSAAAALIPVPEAPVVIVSYESDTLFDFDVVGMSLSEYSAYAEECKDAGFTDISLEYDDYLGAYNDAGDKLTLSYDEDDESMSGSISPSKDTDSSDDAEDAGE